MTARAELLWRIREFFRTREVLEVETPVLVSHAPPDLYLQSIGIVGSAGSQAWLQSSPEYAMKRLLCAGSGPIYQICKAFRAGESGPLHNHEFTMLEWYRPGFDVCTLMDEVSALLAFVGVQAVRPERRLGYREAFHEATGLDPISAQTTQLAIAAGAAGLHGNAGISRDQLLDFLFSRMVQPWLGEGVVFVDDFPINQAALARVSEHDDTVAARFEVFIDGVELANGYDELLDEVECRRRFEDENRQRRASGLPQMSIDGRLLAAMEAGMPPTSGVAVGLDRLLMSRLGVSHIDAVLAFPAARA